MFQMMGAGDDQERVRAGLARAGVRANVLGGPPNRSRIGKRIREALATRGPVSVSSPNSFELIPAQCSEPPDEVIDRLELPSAVHLAAPAHAWWHERTFYVCRRISVYGEKRSYSGHPAMTESEPQWSS
jgi:hypothetical protein